MHGNIAHNLVSAELAISQAFSPLTSFVQCVPRGPPLVSLTASWVMVAKTVNDRIPDRTVHRNQNLFRETNPHRIKNQPAATEIAQAQIVDGLDRGRVFTQSSVQNG